MTRPCKIVPMRYTNKTNGAIGYHIVVSVNEMQNRAYHMKYNDN